MRFISIMLISLGLKLILVRLAMTMTARDFVMQSMKKDNEFGVDGYNLATTMTNFDKPICTKLVSG